MFGVIDCEIMSGLKEMGYSNQMRINLFIIHVTFIVARKLHYAQPYDDVSYVLGMKKYVKCNYRSANPPPIVSLE